MVLGRRKGTALNDYCNHRNAYDLLFCGPTEGQQTSSGHVFGLMHGLGPLGGKVFCAEGSCRHAEQDEARHNDSGNGNDRTTAVLVLQWNSRLPPLEAPVMMAEKRKLFFSFLSQWKLWIQLETADCQPYKYNTSDA